MSRGKRTMLVFFAVLAAGALASSAASAATAGWMVNGTLLVGAKAFATEAPDHAPFKLEGGGATVECEGLTIIGEIKAPTKTADTFGFSGCKAIAPCSIEEPTVTTVSLLSETSLEGALATIQTYKPEAGTTIMSLTFSGSGCVLSGRVPVKGTFEELAPTGQDERTLQLFSAITTTASGELRLGSAAASLGGSALLKLTTGQPWSFL